MFGTYQHSNLRIEVAASADKINESLTEPERLKKWLWPQQLNLSVDGIPVNNWSASSNSVVKLSEGQEFESTLGPAKVGHKVEKLSAGGIRFVLSGSIDGFHEWQWGDGWVQSRLEGISLLPLNRGQTVSLFRLKQYLQQ
ncbi:MAG: hypothetical protein WBB01_02835 [Phormidesmis sp.]